MATLTSYLTAGACLLATASALNAQLVGTWSTKSASVMTGPGFYNPVSDSFIEPAHTGISYSFTADGFYEEAYYRAISNPAKPTCPSSILQFQHGKVTESASGGLLLTPFGVDGRQLMSDPCASKHSVYSRYNQSETILKYQVSKDAYNGATRLDLYKFDGAPMNPMFLAYNPPQMLPTITMNPTTKPTAAAQATAKVKRGEVEVELELPLNKGARHIRNELDGAPSDSNWVWWTGVAMMVTGSAAYFL